MCKATKKKCANLKNKQTFMEINTAVRFLEIVFVLMKVV